MKVNWALVAELVLSLIIIGLLLNYAGIGQVAQAIASIRLEWLALALVFFFGVHFAMAWRISMILSNLGARRPYKDVLMSHFAGMLASDFTPARSGYFTTAFALERNHKVQLEKAMISILGPQMLDFTLKVVTGTVAVWYLVSFYLPKESNTGAFIFAGVVAIGGMITLGLLIMFSRTFAGFLSFVRMFPFGDRAHDLLLKMQDNSHAVKTLLPQLLALLLVTWAFKALSWWAMAEALGISPGVSFPLVVFFAFLQPLTTMLEFVPTPTLAGMGVSEAGSSAVLVLFGVPLGAAVTYAVLIRFFSIAMDSLGAREAVKALRLGQ
jgi:uncharacterized protein (TIRG00374 family)